MRRAELDSGTPMRVSADHVRRSPCLKHAPPSALPGQGAATLDYDLGRRASGQYCVVIVRTGYIVLRRPAFASCSAAMLLSPRIKNRGRPIGRPRFAVVLQGSG